MTKMWAGRNSAETNSAADAFNSSIGFDYRMYKQDITGSIAHAKMLVKCGIITAQEGEQITAGLAEILADIESGALAIDFSAEDIHMFVEQELTTRIGDTGKRLHTARSRNDQVALDTRLYCASKVTEIQTLIAQTITQLANIATNHKDTILPGYTHMQRAQPISLGHYLLAYAMMLDRDYDRLEDSLKRIMVSPIGCCALAGTTFPTNRAFEAGLMNFQSLALNSLDGVSDRDFAIETLSNLSLIMMHLSRFSEELIYWSSWEFGFITISDAFTTGSSIMPQKKNPDMAELIRGKTGRVYGDLMGLLTVMKGLPLAYNKDMQEDKEQLFDGLDTTIACLDVLCRMLPEIKFHPETMRHSAAKGFINATDLADYLAKKGIPFRSAYKISGELVAICIARGCTLEELPLEEYQTACGEISADVYDFIDLNTCMNKRNSLGGTAPESVQFQLEYLNTKYPQSQN